MVKKIKNKFFYEPGDTVLLLEECRRAIVTEITYINFQDLSQRVSLEFPNGESKDDVDTKLFDLLFRRR